MLAREHVKTATAAPILVARQVIMDRQRKVFGYELVYRQTADATALDGTSEQVATARILTDALASIGLDVLTDGKPAFITVDRHTLLRGVPALLPSDRVVFEFGTDVSPDPEVLEACRALQRQGFRLAINAHAEREMTAGLLPVATYLKMDGSRPDSDEAMLVRLLGHTPYRVIPIATHIETLAQFARAADSGFQYFQGFFFGQPVVKEGRAIPAPQLSRLKLVQALQDPNLSVSEIAGLIKHDTALCYRTLRMVNGASVAHRGTVTSIQGALVHLGREPIRRWAALLAFADLSRGASSELLALSAIRARFCEMLAEQHDGSVAPSAAFLVGLCSLLDAILNRPMPAILAELPLPEHVRQALMGELNPLRQLLDCATTYGAGEWDRAATIACGAGVDPRGLQTVYIQALSWARELRTTDLR